jgi:hypothetical protein
MFIAPGAEAYKKDLPQAEIRYLDGGHCSLEEHYHVIAEEIEQFISHQV